jgi:hypothetical protein
MLIAEVVETKTAFKPDQKDDQGNPLPLGAIEVSIGASSSNLGQITSVYARPAVFNRRVPLIGEQVLLMIAPVNDTTTDGIKGRGYIYFSPINATDDLVFHQFPQMMRRGQAIAAPSKGKTKHDRREPGYTFPKVPKKTDNIQPFEGDDIYEGRFGQSIRFGSTVSGGEMGVYSEKPTWKGGENTDPVMIIRLKKPSGSVTQNLGRIGSKYKSTSKYTIEDLSSDDASIYIATTQMLQKFTAGFKKNMDVKTAANWSGKSQIVMDAERLILNAKKDSAFIIGAKEVVITGKRVLLQDDKYKVYLDELMDFLKAWLKADSDLSKGSAMYSTSCGPTSVATNMGDFIKLQSAEWQKFKMP